MPDIPSSPRLSNRLLWIYSVPTMGIGFMFFFLVLYLMKYATDVLLMAPAAVSVIFGVSRVLDAITDPLAGYFSDRTQSRHGRRVPRATRGGSSRAARRAATRGPRSSGWRRCSRRPTAR